MRGSLVPYEIILLSARDTFDFSIELSARAHARIYNAMIYMIATARVGRNDRANRQGRAQLRQD